MKNLTLPGSCLAALVLLFAPACGDDGSVSSPPANNEQDAGDADVSGEDTRQDVPEDVPEDTPEDVVDDVADDVADVDVQRFDAMDSEMDVPLVEEACVTTDDCTLLPLTECIDGACTLNPAGRTYVEVNYVLEVPEELTQVVGVVKSLIGFTGLFMTSFSELQPGDEVIVTYGGGDRVTDIEDGPDVYAWQVAPTLLPQFRMHRVEANDNPLSHNTWQSDIFDYDLVALVDLGGPEPVGLGFEAVDTVVTMRFSDDMSVIEQGVLEGYITREEASTRFVDFQGNCTLSRAICSSYDCDNDPPLSTIADILDCNGAPLDSDVDPLIEGNDAYRARIIFDSVHVVLEEPEE